MSEQQQVTIYPSEVAERMTIRLPDGMRERLKALAQREGRSLNAQVVRFLEAGLRYVE